MVRNHWYLPTRQSRVFAAMISESSASSGILQGGGKKPVSLRMPWMRQSKLKFYETSTVNARLFFNIPCHEMEGLHAARLLLPTNAQQLPRETHLWDCYSDDLTISFFMENLLSSKQWLTDKVLLCRLGSLADIFSPMNKASQSL